MRLETIQKPSLARGRKETHGKSQFRVHAYGDLGISAHLIHLLLKVGEHFVALGQSPLKLLEFLRILLQLKHHKYFEGANEK